MKEHKHAEVLRAIADGEEVQYLDIDNNWVEPKIVNPINYPDLEWRVKPKSPIVVERWVYSDGSVSLCSQANVRFTFDPDTKLPIKVELI